jgi:two-component system sensor histidine kinase PilS (NtrC family)
MAEDALTLRIKALISIRAVFVTLLLGSSYFFKVEYFYAHPRAISYYIILLYTLTIAYSLLLGRVKNLVIFTYVQLILDVVSEIILIYITGGIESWFSFTLILSVLSSSIILGKKAGYVIASLSSILYGGLLDLQFYNILAIPHDVATPEKEFLYKIFIHILSLYVTAYLSGYLSGRLEKTVQKLEEKDIHLRDLELFNFKVIESLPTGLFTTDMDGNISIFNRAAEAITGRKKEEVIGGRIDAVLPFLTFPFEEGRHEKIYQSDKSGRKIIGLNISVLRDTSGNRTGFIGVLQDLTELKRLETEIKQKEKWAAIGELSANIAHEIRNPLASMRGSIEMLKEDKTPVKYREKLMDIALKEMERLNNIITDFLTYSSPRSLDIQRVDLHSLLNETTALLNNIDLAGRDIRILKDFSGSLPVDADPQKMRQVFWNLGVNAIEAMKDSGELVISTAGDADCVRVVFSDTGAGIAPSNLYRIFYPFFTTKDAGTGLGLSIAYRIVEEHKGSLYVNSVPGIKTDFEIILNRKHGK